MNLVRRGLLALALSLPAAAASAQQLPSVYVPVADYPAGVAATREQKVVVAFTPDVQGHAKGCRLVRKSKDERLDGATCRIVMERARFAPGPEQRIQFTWAAADTLQTSRAEAAGPLIIFRDGWVTVNDYPAAALAAEESGKVWYRVNVSASGLPQRCSVVESSGSKSLDEVTCRLVMTRAILIPAPDGHGGTREASGIFVMAWNIG